MLQPNFRPFPVLQTERLLLRKIVPEDSQAILALRSNHDVMKFLDRPRTCSLQQAEEYIKALQEDPGTLMGTIGFWRLLKEHYRVEIGFMLLPGYWRKGILKEALKEVMVYGFNTMRLHSIEAQINPNNAASAGLLTALGFVQEAHLKGNYLYNGNFLDTMVFQD